VNPAEYLQELIETAEKMGDDYMQRLYVNINPAIIVAQKKHEESIMAYKLAGHVYASAEREYQEAKARWTMKFKKEGYPATIINQLVKGRIAKEDEARRIAEADMKYVLKISDAFRERANNLKHISGRIAPLAGDKK